MVPKRGRRTTNNNRISQIHIFHLSNARLGKKTAACTRVAFCVAFCAAVLAAVCGTGWLLCWHRASTAPRSESNRTQVAAKHAAL